MKKVLLILVLLVTASVSASADPVSLTAAEAASLTVITNTGSAAYINQANGRYTAAWDGLVIGPQSVRSGVNFLSRGQANDTFLITISNVNENSWFFQVFLDNGNMSGIQSIAAGSSFTFSIAMTNGPITGFALEVSGVLPQAGDDRTAEYVVTPVPEPASLLLLGTGLAGAAGMVRRRFSKSA